MKKKYVITDVDGVILDRMFLYGEVFSDLLKEYFGINEKFSKKEYFSTSGTPIEEQFQSVIEKAGRSFTVKDISFLVEKFFEVSSKGDLVFFPGAKEVIFKLTMEGCGLFASSGSNTAELKKIFNENNLPYSVVMGSDKIKKGRKHIKIFAESLSLSLIDFAVNAIYIGDGKNDMKIASECGIFAVGILGCPGTMEDELFSAGADVVIEDISEFVHFVL